MSGEVEKQQIEGSYQVTDFGPEAGFSGPGWAGGILHADLSKSKSVGITNSITVFGEPIDFTLRLKGGQPGHQLRVSFGSHFQSFHRADATLEGGEETLTFPAPPEGYAFGGGENDGHVRLPIRLIGLAVERGKGPAEPVDIEFLELSCRTQYDPASPVMITGSCDGAAPLCTASCTGWNIGKEDAVGTLHVAVVDWEGATLLEEARPWTLPASGRPERFEVPFEIPAPLNFAEFTFRFEPKGLEAVDAQTTFTRMPDDPGDPIVTPESPWGMGIYLMRYANTPEGLDMMRTAASYAQRAGVKWSREEIGWRRVEPEQKGKFDFSFFDTVVDTANEHGISVYGLLTYWGNFTEPYTEQGIADYCDYARRTVRHFKDRIRHWEVWNEPNIFFWQGPKDMYTGLLKRAYTAIKEEQPEAEVLGISTCGIDVNFVYRNMLLGAPFDILTVHPYRDVLEDAWLMQEFEIVSRMIGGRDIWVTEMGWGSNAGQSDPAMGPGGVTERAQAQMLARVYLSCVGSGHCGNVSWYNFRSDGDDPFYNEHNFAVLRRNLVPKPGYRALTTVCRSMPSGKPERIDAGAGVLAVRMGAATAVWSAQAQEVRMSCAAGSKAVNLMGEEIAQAEGTAIALPLRAQAPVFILEP